MNKKLTFIFLIVFMALSSTLLANKKREIINAYENGRPAKMDIEVTKVKSTNYIDLYINRSQKKIYRDITESNRETEDLDKKLYVTTYLKPNTKTNTIHDELEHKIITSDGKRYLEISYSKEPENIYLWLVKDNKIEKLYTGIIKNTPNNKAVINSNNLEVWYNYNLNETFLLEIGSNEIIIPNNSLKWYRGGVTKAWNSSEKHIQYKIDVDGSSVTGKTSGGTDSFTVNVDSLLSVSHENITNPNGYKFLITPRLDFQKIILYYETGSNQGASRDYYEDTIIIYGKKNNLYLEKTDMDFGTFSKTEGKTATADINAFNTYGYDYTLGIPKTTTIRSLANDEIEVNLTLELDNSQNNIHYNKIIGTIPEPSSEYKEGSYTGSIPVTVTITPKLRGGRF
ncbi:hypothetical protein [Cetobacterium sp.]|uniref:hypothetical protein n=1 Tax=Cetobacterium sp. TaxID=2071632 RepID=UPI003F3A7670